MLHDFRRFLNDETGATAVEYGLILSVLSLAVIGGFKHAAHAIEFLFGSTDSRLRQAIEP